MVFYLLSGLMRVNLFLGMILAYTFVIEADINNEALQPLHDRRELVDRPRQYRFPSLDKYCRWSKNAELGRDKILILYDNSNPVTLDAIAKNFGVLSESFSFAFASLTSVQRNCPTLFADFDIILHPSPNKLFNVWSNLLSYTRATGFFIGDQAAADIYQQWTTKEGWTKWMQIKKFQQMLPRIYTNDVSFPCYIEFKGVGLLYGMEAKTTREFSDLISSFPKNSSYTVRELVDGLGDMEGVTFGSSHNGRMLALRCAVMDKQVGKKILKSGASQSSYLTPCSPKLVGWTKQILKKANFSGVFQARFNFNSQREIRIVDMSPALGKLPGVFSDLFERVLIPLYFASRFRRNVSVPLNRSVAQHIQAVSLREKAVIDSDGDFPPFAKILQLAKYVEQDQQ